MSNSTATMKFTLTYTSPEGVAAAPPPVSIACPFQAQLVGALDVPDTTPADTELEVPFGSVGDDATMLMVHNRLTQDLAVTINGRQASGTLVAGTKTLNLDNIVGDRLAVKLDASHGTPGVLSVRRISNTQVTVESWLAGTGLQAADVSDVIVTANGETHRLAPGGVFTHAAPAAAGGSPITGMSLKTTATQDGAGMVSFAVFGDPV